MPTKRVRRAPRQCGIPPSALEAWKAGDFLGLHRALGLRPWQLSPFDGVSAYEPEGAGAMYADSWEHAVELRKRLLEAAGPPGKHRGRRRQHSPDRV